MPLEIRELIIKATISGQNNPQQGMDTYEQVRSEEEPKVYLIQEAVERILEILKEKYER